MQIDHHTVLNAITRSIILCDTQPEEAKEGLYALGDYLKYYFAATLRRQTPPSAEEEQRATESLELLQQFLQGKHSA